ncbi:MAG: chemotaxis protein CheW [Ignavibacteria bacterium]
MNTEAITETRSYLAFALDKEIFGVDVLQIREILEYTNITRIPQLPAYICGVINLRGSVVPVIDMREKFGLNKTDITVDTCIVVVEINIDGETCVIGALVDSVEEVFELEPNQIEPAPRMGTRLNTKFIRGMGKRDERFIILLDIDKVFSTEELITLQEVTEAEADA